MSNRHVERHFTRSPPGAQTSRRHASLLSRSGERAASHARLGFVAGVSSSSRINTRGACAGDRPDSTGIAHVCNAPDRPLSSLQPVTRNAHDRFETRTPVRAEPPALHPARRRAAPVAPHTSRPPPASRAHQHLSRWRPALESTRRQSRTWRSGNSTGRRKCRLCRLLPRWRRVARRRSDRSIACSRPTRRDKHGRAGCAQRMLERAWSLPRWA